MRLRSTCLCLNKCTWFNSQRVYRSGTASSCGPWCENLLVLIFIIKKDPLETDSGGCLSSSPGASLRPSVRHFKHYTFFRVTQMHIKLHIKVIHDFKSLIIFTFDLCVTLTLTFFRSTNFLVNALHSIFFYVTLRNLYHISISLIAGMSSKLGKIRLSAIIFVICVISRKPDLIKFKMADLRPLPIYKVSR